LALAGEAELVGAQAGFEAGASVRLIAEDMASLAE
jgi:hypothetical protein